MFLGSSGRFNPDKSSVHVETEPKKKKVLVRSGYVFQSHILSAALKPSSHSYSKTLKGPKDLMSYISYVPMCNPFQLPATAPALPLPPTLSVDCDMICNQLLHFFFVPFVLWMLQSSLPGRAEKCLALALDDSPSRVAWMGMYVPRDEWCVVDGTVSVIIGNHPI